VQRSEEPFGVIRDLNTGVITTDMYGERRDRFAGLLDSH
jgi:hypothetical protein